MLGDQSVGNYVQGQLGNRRLVAAAFADIVGYSILMARDESRTHARWMTILNEIIRPLAAQHHGRVVKSTGDGVLVEFADVADSVNWARNVQRSLAPHDGDEPLPIALRIGINVGEVIVTADDIYGDSVNLAARLQEYAEPGGIVLSEGVYERARGSIVNSADDLGYLELKHVEHPTRAYAIAPVVRGIAVPVLQRRVALPSIAVLPLQNLSGDPSDDYFGDGIVEDITVSLASLRELLVISRATTLKYRGQQPDPRAVGVELGVRYVLMGTVRRSQRMMRVSVQLCDTESGASIWGDKEQISPDDLFEMQDNVVTRIVAGIAPYVRQTQLQAALRKRPDSFTAYDYTLRALDLIKGLNRTRFMQAREYLRRAMAEDPNFAMPAAWAARWHSRYVGQGWSQNKSRDSSEAIALAAKAIELDGQNSLALATYGHLKSYLLHDYDAAVACFARALSSCPSNALAWMLSSNTFAYLGDGDEALQRAEHALHLSPFDSGIGFYYSTLAIAHYVRGSFTEAAKWSRMSVNENPAYTSNLRYLTAILVGLGDLGEAREIAAELLRREPDFRLSEWQQRQPIHDPDISVKHIERLALAGLPW